MAKRNSERQLLTEDLLAGSLAKSNELGRLYRDVRAGGFHPPSANTASEVIGGTYLGAPASTLNAGKVKPSGTNGAVPEKLPTFS